MDFCLQLGMALGEGTRTEYRMVPASISCAGQSNEEKTAEAVYRTSSNMGASARWRIWDDSLAQISTEDCTCQLLVPACSTHTRRKHAHTTFSISA